MNFSLKKYIINAVKKRSGYWTIPSCQNIDYPETGNTECFGIEENSYWFNHRNACIGKLLDLYPPSGPILDIGAGNGFVALLAEKKGFAVILLEPGLDGVINAGKRGLSHIVRGNLEKAKIKEDSFGGVFLFDVLEHIKNDSKFLGKVYEILRKNGFIFISVPAHRLLWSSEDDLAGHYRRYNLNQLIRLLNDKGFDIVYASYYFTLLLLPILLTRSLPEKIFGVRKKSFRLNTGDYVIKSKILNSILGLFLNWEKFFMGKGSIRFGSSIILVGKKV